MATTFSILSAKPTSNLFNRLSDTLQQIPLVQINAVVFQSVKIPLDGSIVVVNSCFAHTLSHMDRFARIPQTLSMYIGNLGSW